MNEMRDCIFLVADKNIEGMLKGFFARNSFCKSLGCGNFIFDFKQDLVVAHGQSDPGLYTRASEFLKPYFRTHRHAVIVMDVEWDGSPGGTAISNRLFQHIKDAGWSEDKGCAVVIDPELENWIWQDNVHVCSALGYEGPFSDLLEDLIRKRFWEKGAAKPHRPKEAVEWVLRKTRRSRSSAIYRKIANQVSVRGCTDDAFKALLSCLSHWFPPNT